MKDRSDIELWARRLSSFLTIVCLRDDPDMTVGVCIVIEYKKYDKPLLIINVKSLSHIDDGISIK